MARRRRRASSHRRSKHYCRICKGPHKHRHGRK